METVTSQQRIQPWVRMARQQLSLQKIWKILTILQKSFANSTFIARNQTAPMLIKVPPRHPALQWTQAQNVHLVLLARITNAHLVILHQPRNSNTKCHRIASSDPFAKIQSVHSSTAARNHVAMVATAPHKDVLSSTARLNASLLLARMRTASTSTRRASVRLPHQGMSGLQMVLVMSAIGNLW